jgi:hypothetical protein
LKNEDTQKPKQSRTRHTYTVTVTNSTTSNLTKEEVFKQMEWWFEDIILNLESLLDETDKNEKK